MTMKEKLTDTITLKVTKKSFDGYMEELTESERDELRAELRLMLAKKIHAKRFKAEEWE